MLKSHPRKYLKKEKLANRFEVYTLQNHLPILKIQIKFRKFNDKLILFEQHIMRIKTITNL